MAVYNVLLTYSLDKIKYVKIDFSNVCRKGQLHKNITSFTWVKVTLVLLTLSYICFSLSSASLPFHLRAQYKLVYYLNV